MTDSTLAAPGPLQRRVDVSSDASRARVARRYRAERRFRLYGLAAILFAALFLVILLADIFVKAIPAFMQSELALDVVVSSELVDPQKPAAGDFDKMIREGLYVLFPQMKSRTERRALQDVLSSGAADDLRSMVVADPGLIGQRVQAPVLLSADADLYLKGISTTIVDIARRRRSNPERDDGQGHVVLDLERVHRAVADRKKAARHECGSFHARGRPFEPRLSARWKRI